MKKMKLIAIFSALLLSFVGCGQQPSQAANASGNADSSVQTQPLANGSSEEDKNATALAKNGGAENAAQDSAGAAALATETSANSVLGEKGQDLLDQGALLYRGVVDDFAVDDKGNTVWILRQADGSDFGSPSLNVTVTQDTQYSYGKDEQVGNGSYLEVCYKLDENGQAQAQMVNLLQPVELILYNGIVKEVTPDAQDPRKGSLLLSGLQEEDMGYVFHYSEETKFYVPLDAIQAGDTLSVFHSPASTRSIPPQSAAFEIRTYAAGQALTDEPILG